MKTPLGKIAAAFVVLVLATGTATRAQAQTFTTLHSFNKTDGANPYSAALVQATDGNFYGTTYRGGANNAGTVFKITPSGTLTTLYNFCSQSGCVDGAFPIAGLVQATDGNFYGTTYGGGASSACSGSGGCGTVFKISPSGTLTTLHSFTLGTDGGNPFAGLVQATDGNFYGTAANAPLGGTVFKITPSGTLTTLYSFCSQSNCTDGLFPIAGLVQATDGNFYGTTEEGGANGIQYGTVFKITPSGTLTTLYNFCSQSGCTDGFFPIAGLVQGTDGNFYGTTNRGGASSDGTVFKITPSGTLTTLYNFCSQSGCTDGFFPSAGLVQATDANLYGTTIGGGASSGGTVFKISPSGTLTTLYNFCSQSGCVDGAFPLGALVQATDGKFYGTTSGGGANNSCTVFGTGCGTVFSLTVLTPPAPTITSISPDSAIAGGAAFTLAVNGTNFVSGSTVSFNGSARTTNFVSATQLTAAILASDIATAGSFNVTVTNTSGRTSSPVSFTVLTPQQETEAIINSVNALSSQGVVNGGQANSLLVKLQHAIARLNAGNKAAAIGNLNAFIGEVNDLLSSGILSPSQASLLISAAQSVIAAL